MVLRKFFFSGGSTSFVVRFSGLFTKQDGFGSVRHEVPLPMVCLVATVVSRKLNLFLNLVLIWGFFF